MRTIAIAAALLAVLSTAAEAKSKHRSGACDGIHRCRCGSTQAAHFGLPRNYNGHNLWRASEWPRAFPRTTPRAGVVMYQHGGGPSGHVSRLLTDPVRCIATVADDAGTYERNVCIRGARFMSVGSHEAAAHSIAP